MAKNTIRPKIGKLLKALKFNYNKIFLYNTEQLWSKKLERVVVIRKLFFVNQDTGKRKEVFSSFKELEILKFLVSLYKKGGDLDAENTDRKQEGQEADSQG